MFRLKIQEKYKKVKNLILAIIVVIKLPKALTNKKYYKQEV